PILSGPGSIGVVIGLSTQKMSAMTYAGSTLGILLIGLSVFIVLSLSVNLYRIIGKTGVGVINRIMGFFILAIAVQLITEGIKAVLKI
ncbi:MAG TPA: MarC family protein, partial [Ignavibacteria bacterium]|nr:MarC family protein [Ignavibacteria bacterium]